MANPFVAFVNHISQGSRQPTEDELDFALSEMVTEQQKGLSYMSLDPSIQALQVRCWAYRYQYGAKGPDLRREAV